MYYKLGQIAGMSLVHGGSSFCLLADPVVSYISGASISDIAVPTEDIQDDEAKILIDQVAIGLGSIVILVLNILPVSKIY